MIKNIVRDVELLKNKSTDASIDDLYIAKDLRDTLAFNSHRCVGMAANMIGYFKNIIIFQNNKKEYQIMINPKIIKCEGEYKIFEGCLSLDGEREAKRYKKIKVQYYDELFKIKIKTFVDFEAQIIQHEIDHLSGIII